MNSNNTTLHVSQLFRLMMLFELGSALVFPLNSDAKEAAWISTLLGMLLGLVLFTVVCYILKDHPYQPFTVVLESLIGKVLGKTLAFLYTLFFIYQATRQFNDFALLMNVSIFEETPLLIIHLMMVLAISYVLSLGIVALARTGEIFYLVMFVMIVLASLFIMVSGVLDVHRLMPILGDGVSSILQSFPKALNFPFSEVIAFAMFTPYLKRSDSLLRTGIVSLMISGGVLTWITVLNISVLGVDIVSQSFFPFLMSIGEVNISDFIQRLDAIAVMMLIIGVFFKASIFYLAAVIAVSHLFKMSDYKKILLIVGTTIFLSALIVSPNSSHHLQEGLVSDQWLIYLPFEITIPVILAMGIWIYKKLA
ncbi:GerAB/ArcD/ProY family transporter [Paenibacillus sp. 1001270B_150601_E10]|uniref:GerAB/ArcD/ProY family transporter n=1 Tax=Paenibacillus sp. 1001270B_150601_E10 TaxID=2787079 RepID=UPI001E404118|nr:GerAB/ArcD/ProY family transporter [Paenibacillus sp. 1001270B_150601_E10]